VVQQEPQLQDNAKYIWRLKEELRRTRATTEECTKFIEDLKSQVLAKDELISLLEQK
jgi:hypothetical protein